jgi:hypothetical protein
VTDFFREPLKLEIQERGRLPTLLIVILHVIPPAIFALIHGGILYRMKGISIFVAFCFGFGGLAEAVSLP